MVERCKAILPRSGFVHLATSKSLLNYNMIAEMIWISQDLKALIFAEADSTGRDNPERKPP